MKFFLERWLKNRRLRNVRQETDAAMAADAMTDASAAAVLRTELHLQQNRQMPARQQLLKQHREVRTDYVDAESSKIQKTSPSQL